MTGLSVGVISGICLCEVTEARTGRLRPRAGVGASARRSLSRGSVRGNGALVPWWQRLPFAGYPPRYGEFGHLPTWIPFSLPGGLSPGVFLGVVLGVARGVAWGCSAAHSGFLPVIPDTSGAPGGGSPSLSLSFRCILLRYYGSSHWEPATASWSWRVSQPKAEREECDGGWSSGTVEESVAFCRLSPTVC